MKTKSEKAKLFNLEATFKAKESDNGTIRIIGYASTADTDRAGDVILPDAWTKNGGVDNFSKNPIILFNHNYNKPIGKATSITVDGKGLHIEAEISSADKEIQQLIKDGVLSTFSVGFAIKDADYIQETNGLLIKEAELYETSVVSVPCNQDAVFSLSKSFDSDKDYEEFKKTFTKQAEPTADELAKANTDAGKKPEDEDDSSNKENKMDPEELKALLVAAAKEGADAATKAVAIEAKRIADEAKSTLEAEEKFNVQVKTSAERLFADIEKRFNEKNESLESIVSELREDLVSKSGEIEAMRQSKRHFSDRNSVTSDWKKEFGEDITDKYLLGLATGKGWDTKAGKELREKIVSTTSGVEVSSVDFEQIVSTNIERDIQNELILADMFRTLPMTSNSMILPIMPDAGYAEFVARNAGNGTQTAPKGNLDERGVAYGTNAGVDLGERTVSTSRLMSTSYLGNETEEDAILPILGLIRESMVRSHARSIEQSILLGNSAQGVYASGIYDGLTECAIDAGTATALTGPFAAGDVITAKDLFNMRKSMGKYGMRPDDVVYIVSQDAYYNLIEDAEFEDANLVGALATKVKGTIGRVYGSNVIVCDEFPTKAIDAYAAVCVNVRNYLMPILRGLTIESDYLVKEQHRVLVASQRVGFVDIIEDVNSVSSLAWAPVA